ncbi:BtrH N-terminal domain-containing protein [Sphaerisporangium sp. NPDC051017]|uniref:BtrH N-terminal domain-containing protein n=1 Tax=Sphaerisporangium sp. NPDC051017 TaxID=3154636 RepID=UPI003437EBA3
MSTTPPAAPALWYRDLISCLQSTLAAALLREGRDPVDALGAHWEFLFKPGDVTSEEFYYPCRYPGDLGRSLAPHHGLSTTWHRPADPGDPLEDVRRALKDGHHPVIAVDNFHLPFRPAYQDVHAAHLIVVYGLDEAAGQAYVSDAMPPAHAGPIPVDALLAAWTSANPKDVQDAFFSDSAIGGRYLTVTVGDAPATTPAFVREVLTAGVAGFEADRDTAGWGGLAGVRDFTTSLADRARAGDARALEEAYPFGWGMQAQAALHAEFLRSCGTRWELPALREAGRLAEHVAHAWTGVRITAAHGRRDPAAAAPDLARHGGRLVAAYEAAVAGLREAAGFL